MIYPLMLLTGLFLLVKGADRLIENASELAARLGISKTLIALTVVAMGTSLPELTVNAVASFDRKHDIILGNVIGSNIANLLLILGVSGAISQLRFDERAVRSELTVSLAAILLMAAAANDVILFGSPGNALSRPEGVFMLVCFAAFLSFTFKRAFVAPAEVSDGAAPVEGEPEKPVLRIAAVIALSMAALLGGGKLTVDSATAIARQFGLSEKLIALTIISIGTSLPELVTSAMAAYKGQFEISTGNVTGSNIFNILLVLGLSSSIGDVGYDTAFNTDVLVLAAASAYVIAAMFVGRRYHFGRLKSFPLLAGFIAYMIYLILRN